MIVSLILFLSFLLFFLYFPAKAILSGIFKISFTDPVIDISLNTVFGFAVLILAMAIFELIGLPKLIIYIFPVFPLVYISKFRKFPKIHFSRPGLMVLFIILSFSLIQAFPLFYGGMETDQGLSFISVHDNLWNISIINNLNKNFPPEHPSLSGSLLKNHHYFFLYFLALVGRVTKIGVFDLYFRLGPVFASFLFAAGLYLVSTLFTKNIAFRVLNIFLGVFSGNFAYLIPVFLPSVKDWRGNLLFADQPFDQIFNPYTIMGYAVFLTVIFCIQNYIVGSKISSGWLILTSIFIGISFGIKSFGAVILLSSLFILLPVSLIFKKFRKIILLSFLSIIIFLPVFFLISKPGTVSMIFIPGWILTEMMVGKDKLNLPLFADKENYYLSINNYLGLIKIKLIELSLYIVGNLGVRLLGLFYLFKLLMVKEIRDRKFLYFFIFILTVVSLAIPLLFNLSVSPYNIIQFTPYSLILLALFTAFFMESVFYLAFKKKMIIIGYILIISVIILAVPVNIKNILSKINPSGDIVDKSEVEILEYIAKSKRQNKLILIDPAMFTKSPIYIPALSNSPVFVADPGYVKQTGYDPEPRLIEIRQFFSGNMEDSEYIKKNNIAYIYLLKDNKTFLIDRKLLFFDKIYSVAHENEKVLLLESKI